MIEIADPFYLGNFEAGQPKILFRCLDGPSNGCANDTLPDGEILEAGGDKRYIVFRTVEGYYYFQRVVEERRGWGNNPERVVGPLPEVEFDRATKQLQLPGLSITP